MTQTFFADRTTVSECDLWHSSGQIWEAKIATVSKTEKKWTSPSKLQTRVQCSQTRDAFPETIEQVGLALKTERCEHLQCTYCRLARSCWSQHALSWRTSTPSACLWCWHCDRFRVTTLWLDCSIRAMKLPWMSMSWLLLDIGLHEGWQAGIGEPGEWGAPGRPSQTGAAGARTWIHPPDIPTAGVSCSALSRKGHSALTSLGSRQHLYECTVEIDCASHPSQARQKQMKLEMTVITGGNSGQHITVQTDDLVPTYNNNKKKKCCEDNRDKNWNRQTEY